jgi:hypothetical protein
MKHGSVTQWSQQSSLNNADHITQLPANITSIITHNFPMIPMDITQELPSEEPITISLAIFSIKTSPWIRRLGTMLHLASLTKLLSMNPIRNDYKL